MKIKLLSVLFAFFGAVIHLHAATSFDDKWTKCSKAKECVAVLNECNQPDAVNKKYLSEHQSWVAYSRPLVDCIAGSFKDGQEIAEFLNMKSKVVGCVEKRCVVIVAPGFSHKGSRPR